MLQKKSKLSRRTFITRTTAATAAVAAGSLVTNADLENVTAQVNTNSSPTDLKITDMRIVQVGEEGDITIRLDTNQGISGYGDVRGTTSKTLALVLKSRIVGMNPCNVTEIFRKIKKHGTWGRQGGGPSAVEQACWDLAGKAWGVPVWQMLGGKMRDRIRMYCDVSGGTDGAQVGKNIRQQMDKGWTFAKISVGAARIAQDVEGAFSVPAQDPTAHEVTFEGDGRINPYGNHPFTGQLITDKGLDKIEEWCEKVREYAGWEMPIATDHYGRMPIESHIKFARRLDKFNFAWYEDLVPWFYPDQVLRIKEACTTPICTGEDAYLCEGFKDLFAMKAISVAHPDPMGFGGILESKKLCDLATSLGIATAFHNHHVSPVGMVASAHAAAAADQFLALEYHRYDEPGNTDWIKWTDKPNDPIIDRGFIRVPNGPGLGIELDYDILKERLAVPGLFEPTPEWDNEVINDGHS